MNASIVTALEAGRRDFLDATRGLTPAQALAKPDPANWSVLDCIEHVIAAEERYLDWISNAAAILPNRDTAKELRLFTTIRSRLRKVQSPDVFLPQGRFHSLTDAIAAFNAVRDRSVKLAEQHRATLYAIGTKHPYFGNVNAAELLHLLDGHTRRHADQIREIRDASPWQTVSVSMKSAPTRKPAAFKRDPPDLPTEFHSIPLFEDREILTINEKCLQDLQQTKLKADSLRIDGSLLNRVHFSDSQFASLLFKDVRLTGCDLANIHARRVSFLRVELIDCRLTGFRATALEWQDVLIQNGDARYSQWQAGKFKTCEFNSCDFQDADFQEADLSGSLLKSCNLSRADLRNAKLKNTDFRKSDVDTMVVGIKDLQGAIVDASQAMAFARLLGLQIL